MLLFLTLIVPMPFKIKRGIFEFISGNPLVAKLQYGMKVSIRVWNGRSRAELTTAKITFIFILILFVDSVNRVYRVQVELSMAKQQGGAAA